MARIIKVNPLRIYKHELYTIRKKAIYLFFFSLMMLLLCTIGLVFSEDSSDLIFYAASFSGFSAVLLVLPSGRLHQAAALAIIIIPLCIFIDIMQMEFTSYEKIMETIMEAFLSYLAITLFATKKRHIIFTIGANTGLTVFHAVLLAQLVYGGVPLPDEAIKYFTGGTASVLFAGLMVWFSFQANEEALETVTRSREELEELISMRTNELKTANEALEKANSELLTISTLDPLTGVFNRRKIIEAAEFLKKEHQSLTMIMIDIDHFKNINDQFGHAAGDTAIQAAVNVCTHYLRPADCIGRMGGEEFLLILSGTDRAGAALLVNCIRSHIEKSVYFTPGGTRFHMTISAGISHLRQNDSIEEGLEQADRALYAAKNKGRNRIMVS